MFTEDVPEFIPISKQGIFGETSQKESKNPEPKSTKAVTHLEIDCFASDNWDADAEDDGITYSIKPLSTDKTIIPIEGTYLTEVYERVQTDSLGFTFEKGNLVYSSKGSFIGTERLDHFNDWIGYKVQLPWDEVLLSHLDEEAYGIMYVTFTDLDGNSFQGKTGDDYLDGCRLNKKEN